MTDILKDIGSNKPAYWIEGVQDVGLNVVASWERFRGASDLVEAADAITALSNDIFELSSYLPGFDYERGAINWELITGALDD